MKAIIILILIPLCTTLGLAQESPVASGGNAAGSGGSAAYSIGQPLYTTHMDPTGSVSLGVQQAYEIYSVGLEAIPPNMAMTVYPNPTTDNLTLQVDAVGDISLTYQLFDIQGRLLAEDLVQNHTQINTRNLPAGMYMLTVRQGVQPIQSFKIVKNK